MPYTQPDTRDQRVPRRGSQRTRCAVAASVAVVASTGAGGSTGAWSTAQDPSGGISLAAASMSTVTGVAAGIRCEDANIRWDSALTQTWATADSDERGSGPAAAPPFGLDAREDMLQRGDGTVPEAT